MTPVTMLDLKSQHASLDGAIRAAIDRVLTTQQFILGPEVEALEASVASYSECAHGVGVSSGTDAILLALMALGIGRDDEVITTPYTFAATATCIARLGARAVFADIDPKTFNLDASRVEALITPKTKAIVPVHLFGHMADVASLERLGVPIVEDAAQSIGARAHGRRAGSIGAFGCLSFFPSKNLGALGDAGMLLCNDARLAGRARMLRSQGQQSRNVSVEVGGNFRLDALQAAVLRVKLEHLDAWTEKRRANAARYRAWFTEAGLLGDVELPVELPAHEHVYNQFVIRARKRDELRAFLASRDIASEVYYPRPIHLQPAFCGWGYEAGAFPESERAAHESLAIPIHPQLDEEQQRSVVAAIRTFFR